MEQYIPKSALVAKINKRIMDAPIDCYGHQRVWAYNDVKDIVDTLEVKEEMTAKAFPAEIDSSRSDGRCILSGNFARFETGERVKVIVIKEE